MYITTIDLYSLPGKKKEIIQTLLELNHQVVAEDKCLSSRLYQDLEEKNRLYLIDKWKTQTDLEMYKQSQAYQILNGLDGLLTDTLTIKHGVECNMLKIYS